MSLLKTAQQKPITSNNHLTSKFFIKEFCWKNKNNNGRWYYYFNKNDPLQGLAFTNKNINKIFSQEKFFINEREIAYGEIESNAQPVISKLVNQHQYPKLSKMSSFLMFDLPHSASKVLIKSESLSEFNLTQKDCCDFSDFIISLITRNLLGELIPQGYQLLHNKDFIEETYYRHKAYNGKNFWTLEEYENLIQINLLDILSHKAFNRYFNERAIDLIKHPQIIKNTLMELLLGNNGVIITANYPVIGLSNILPFDLNNKRFFIPLNKYNLLFLDKNIGVNSQISSTFCIEIISAYWDLILCLGDEFVMPLPIGFH